MSCVTIGGQEVSARSILPHSKRPLIGSLFNKSKQSPRDHNRRLLQQNLPLATNALAANCTNRKTANAAVLAKFDQVYWVRR